MKVEGKGKNADLFFKGPKEVEKGTKLEIVNKTSPSKVGPHTFTLIKQNRLPSTKAEIKDCEKLKLAVCVNAFKAHEVDPNDVRGQQAEGRGRQEGLGQVVRQDRRLLVHRCRGRSQHPQGLGQRRQEALLLLPRPPLHAGQGQGRQVREAAPARSRLGGGSSVLRIG